MHYRDTTKSLTLFSSANNHCKKRRMSLYRFCVSQNYKLLVSWLSWCEMMLISSHTAPLCGRLWKPRWTMTYNGQFVWFSHDSDTNIQITMLVAYCGTQCQLVSARLPPCNACFGSFSTFLRTGLSVLELDVFFLEAGIELDTEVTHNIPQITHHTDLLWFNKLWFNYKS